MVTEHVQGEAWTIRLNPSDDIVIACRDIPAGAILNQYGLTVRDPIPAGHKIAIRDVAASQPVRRYSQIIGFASEPIFAGELCVFVVN
jgi:altronate hydrolase